MPKVSQVPDDPTPANADYLLGNQSSGPSTKSFKLSNLIAWFWTLANIPTGATSPITRDNEAQFAFIASGMVWSGDSYGVNRNASMTAGVCYINGRRISIAAVTARTFTASVDTYIDVLDNGDGTGTLVYTTALNNAASPALAANSIRIGIIITGATTIANSGSVNQGQETAVLPIASSIAYTTTDSLGNLITPRDATRRLLGLRILPSGFTTTNLTATQITGLTVPVLVPTGRRVKASVGGKDLFTGTSGAGALLTIWEGVVGSGTQLGDGLGISANGSGAAGAVASALRTPASSSQTYNAGLHAVSAATAQIQSGATEQCYLMIELY